jgi:hypothetical protein
MSSRSPRAWTWAAVIVQCAGLVFDVIWHGFLNPGFSPVTVPEMVRHLTTVHLPIYIGVLSVFMATAWAAYRSLLARIGRSERWTATRIAFAGACISIAGEAWHAYSHLQLSTHGGAIAGMTSVVGLVVVVVTLVASGRRRRRGSDRVGHRRAA